MSSLRHCRLFALSVLCAASLLAVPRHAQAAVTVLGRTFYGDTTNAGTYKYATLSGETEGAEVSGNASAASNITFIKAAHAPTRDEFLIGHIKLSGRLDVFTCVGGCDDTSDDTSQFNKTTVSTTQTCDTTFGSCWRPFDIAYETGSGRGLVAFADTTTDGVIQYCLWNGSGWSPASCTTPSTFTFNAGSSVDTRFVRLVAQDVNLKSGRSNRILLLVSDANNDLFAAIWDGTSFGNLTTITQSLSTAEIQSFDGAWEKTTGAAFVAWSEGTSATTTPFSYKRWNTVSWDGSATAFPTMGASHIGHWVSAAGTSIDGSNHIAIMTTSASSVGNSCGTTSQCRGQPWIWDGSSITRGNEWTTGEPVFAQLCDVAPEANKTTVKFVYICSHGAASDSSDTQTWDEESESFSAITDISGAQGDDATLLQAAAHPNDVSVWITGEDVDADCNGSLWNGSTAATWDSTGCNSTGETALAPVSHTAQPSEGFPFWVAPIPYSPYSRNWRFYDDETVNDPSTGLNGAAENAAPTEIYKEEYFRLRMQFRELAANGQSDSRKRLEWTTDPPTWSGATWTPVRDATNTSGIWRYGAYSEGNPVCSSCDDNTAISTLRLTGSTEAGTYITDRNDAGGSNMDHSALGIVEYDFPLKAESVSPSTTYYFRAYDVDQNSPVYPRADVTNDCLSAGCAYPSLTTSSLELPAGPILNDVPFDNARIADDTPALEFTGSDPNAGNTLVYQVEWDDDANLNDAPLGTCASDSTPCGGTFENTTDPFDTSPFDEDELIRFTLSSALTNGLTYYWRVRVKDTSIGEYGSWSATHSFTVSTSLTQTNWHQTEDAQFDHGTLSDTETYGSNQVRLPSTPRRAMLAYGHSTTTSPYYRIWNGSAWGASGAALDTGSQISWVVTKAASTRGGEYMVATIGTDGGVDAQIFNRLTSTWGNFQTLGTVSNATRRGVAAAYDSQSGSGMIVHCDGDADPSYWIWNGEDWVGPGTVDFTSSANCEWLHLAADPTSGEMIVVEQDASRNYQALVWNGSSWGDETIGPAVSAAAGVEAMDVQYEESGDQAIVVTGNTTNNSFYWNAWNGSWGSWTTQTIGNDFMRGVVRGDSGTDNMALCYIDTDNDIGMVRWGGASWSTYQEFEITGNADTDRAVDCVFETNGGRDGYLIEPYSDTASTAFNGWNGSTLFGKGDIAGIEDAATVQARRTGEGTVLVIVLDDGNTRLDASSWDGSSWSVAETLEENPSDTVTPFNEPFMMDAAQILGQGTIMSPAIDFDWVSSAAWDRIQWSTDETNGSILMQVYYSDAADCDTIIPDGNLPGNAAGFTSGTIDISALNTTTYNRICLQATLTFSGGTPYLTSWTVLWNDPSSPVSTSKKHWGKLWIPGGL